MLASITSSHDENNKVASISKSNAIRNGISNISTHSSLCTGFSFQSLGFTVETCSQLVLFSFFFFYPLLLCWGSPS